MNDIEAELNGPEAELHGDSSEEERSLGPIKPTSLLHLSPTKGQSKENGFHKSTRLCLNAIRDAILHHRWQDAVQYLAAYTQTLEDTTVLKQSMACEIIWRLGTETLQHLPNSKLEDFNALYEQMKNSGVKNYAKICLEQSFHLLLTGHIYEARQQLSVAASWRYGKQCASQSLELKLIHAYCGFLDYLIWSTKRSSVSEEEVSTSNRDIHSYFRQAIVTLQEMVKLPGVWDPFVLSCIDMMEFYSDQEGALKLLQNYAHNKDFGSNPNAHVYLYQYLKRHEAQPAVLISTLKVLQSLIPSHELMLEYCALLLKSDEKEDNKEALSVAMNLLEHFSWKTDLNAWKCLLNILKCLENKHHNDLINEEWDKRKDMWLAMHYKSCHGKKDSEENVELLHVKTKVLGVFGVSNGCYIWVHDLGKKSSPVKRTKQKEMP